MTSGKAVFLVSLSARHGFPGIIAVHANADYVLNFEKEMGVQSQIEDLGRHSDSEFIALLDSEFECRRPYRPRSHRTTRKRTPGFESEG